MKLRSGLDALPLDGFYQFYSSKVIRGADTFCAVCRSSIGWPGRPVYFAAVLFFSFFDTELTDENRPSRRPPILHQQWGPSGTHKISTDIRPVLRPPFLQGQNVPNFDPSRFRTAVFLNLDALSENRNKPYICHHTKFGMGGSPQLPEPLAQWVPQRVKVEISLYILRSSGPRRVHRHQRYTTCWGRSCCKKTTVPSPNSPPNFTGRGQNQPPLV